ncbi:MAG: ISL3 family transposase [Rubrobacteraceae bacterium]
MTLLPKAPGLRLEETFIEDDTVSLTLASTSLPVACPVCNRKTARLHSHYGRTVADLPWSGRRVRLFLRVRKFRCSQEGCPRRIFTERLPDLVESYARKTARLHEVLELVGFALGGEAGARLIRRLGMATSPSTLLRYIRRAAAAAYQTPHIVGVDDFALRRGQRYATIIVDLERHRPIDLLPDRSAEALADWLRANPGIEVVARDRYRPYIEGVSTGAPGAVQVADRFHVLKNLYDAVERAVERNRRALHEPDDSSEERGEVPATEPPPGAGHPGWGHRSNPKKRQERLDLYGRVVELRERGLYVEDIAGEVGLSQSTVVSWLNAGGFPERKRPRRKKPSPVVPYAEYLEQRWKERCINMSRLWREIKGMGYEGSYDAVADHLRCLRKGLSPPARTPTTNEGKTQGARHESQGTARLLMLETRDPDAVRPEEGQWLGELRLRCPELAAVQDLAGRFARIMREGEEGELGSWLEEAESSSLSEIRTFARGVRQDEAAIGAAVILPYSNGQVEGQVNRLKLIKRSMYGRASFGLLRQRVLRDA